MGSPSYIIISPVRNEAQYLPLTIQSIIAQKIRPRQWIIVDDGSQDETGRIAQEIADVQPWIKVVRRPDRGHRHAGGGVMDAFYAGYDHMGDEKWDYLVKLDGDLSFEPDYFERCFRRFEAASRLGIAGGTISNLLHGRVVPESTVDPRFHVRGATKIYRRECWEQLGGLIRNAGWDTLDEVKANMLGWQTCTFDDIALMHHRPAGHAYGAWKNWVKNGRANYVVGYHPLFMLAKCLRRMFVKPYLLGGCGLLVGFVGGYLGGGPQMVEKDVKQYFRRQQINRLLGRPSLWDRPAARA